MRTKEKKRQTKLFAENRNDQIKTSQIDGQVEEITDYRNENLRKTQNSTHPEKIEKQYMKGIDYTEQAHGDDQYLLFPFGSLSFERLSSGSMIFHRFRFK